MQQRNKGWLNWLAVVMLVIGGAMLQRGLVKPQLRPYQVATSSVNNDSLMVTPTQCQSYRSK